MSEYLDLLANPAFWIAVLRIATPLIFGTLGVLLCERAGVLNLGIEGIMVAGAFTGWLAVYSGPAAVGRRGCGGGDRRRVRGAACLPHRGTRAVAARLRPGHHAAGHRAQRLRLPRELSQGEHAAHGEAVRAHGGTGHPHPVRADAAHAAGLLLVPAIAWFLYRTPAGLALRMVGENPQAAESQGISVLAARSAAVMAGSALMGVAGAFLTLSAFDAFFFNMVNGRGWICVALVVFASWRPGKALLGALLFAFFDALQLRLQQSGDAALPYQVYLMLPYALSILALVLVARRAAYPQALMKPYRKGER
jgi:simple sugar transport system permease protein